MDRTSVEVELVSLGPNSFSAFASSSSTITNCAGSGDNVDAQLQPEPQNISTSLNVNAKREPDTQPAVGTTGVPIPVRSNLESDSPQKSAAQAQSTLTGTATVSDDKFVIALRSFIPPKPEQQLTFNRGDVIQVVRDTGKWHLGVILPRNGVPAPDRKTKPKFYPPNYMKPFHFRAGSANPDASPGQKAISITSKSTPTPTPTSTAPLAETAQASTVHVLDNQCGPESIPLGSGTSRTCNATGASAINETAKNSDLATSTSTDKSNTKTDTLNKKIAVAPSRDRAVAVYVRARAGYEAKKPGQLSFAKGDIIQVIDSKSNKWHRGMLVKSKQYPLTKSKALFYPSNFVQPVIRTQT